MRFYKTNDISQNFSGITLGFYEVSKYFVYFQFHYWYCQKMTVKFWFLLNWFKISKFCTFRWRKLKRSISQLPSGSGSSWTRTLKLSMMRRGCDGDLSPVILSQVFLSPDRMSLVLVFVDNVASHNFASISFQHKMTKCR